MGRQHDYNASVKGENFNMADKTFGDNLSKSRKKAGLSQEELAEKMGITRQTISKWETGVSHS